MSGLTIKGKPVKWFGKGFEAWRCAVKPPSTYRIADLLEDERYVAERSPVFAEYLRSRLDTFPESESLPDIQPTPEITSIGETVSNMEDVLPPALRPCHWQTCLYLQSSVAGIPEIEGRESQ